MSDTDADIQAAYEFCRRAAKGLPSDRLYDGAAGAMRVARGILKLGTIIADYEENEKARGHEAMRLHSADSKYKRE